MPNLRFTAPIVFFILCINGLLSAQPNAALEARLNAAGTDGERYALHTQLAQSRLADDLEKADFHAQKAIALAKTLQNKALETEAILLSAQIAQRKNRPQDALDRYSQAREAAIAAGLPEVVLQSVERLQELSAQQGDYQAAYRWSNERSNLLQEKSRQYANEESEKHLAAQAELEAQKKRASRIWLAALLGLLITMSIFYYLRQRSNRRMRGELAEKNAMIEEKRRRSEQLLLNILPRAVAAELTVRNKVLARRYERATVMFADFVGFTYVSEQLEPEVLVQELDFCFSQFDNIIGRFRIEKIKTVGDAYICASGLSDRNEHPGDMIRAAIAMQAFLKKYNDERSTTGRPQLEARIGIHFGPVVAGVVGAKKFAYDIWGDTVNTAARLEEGGEPGRINISEATWELVREEFSCTFRGRFPAKNKGEIGMYFVEGLTQKSTAPDSQNHNQ